MNAANPTVSNKLDLAETFVSDFMLFVSNPAIDGNQTIFDQSLRSVTSHLASALYNLT